MGSEVFLEQYRIRAGEGDAPVEIARNGPAITYKASDLKSGAPVALTLVPVDSVDPAERDSFERMAHTAMLLDHPHVARTVAFGTADKSYVFVSEYPQGETVEKWVKTNGPMPADAVLRVALQMVAAFQAASFHGLTHPTVQPSNIAIVRDKTAEGGWPFVKLTHFALAGFKSAPERTEPDLGASEFASPEQLLCGKVDFQSEIFSLGATMCFLLTGVFYSAYPRSPQTKRFARPLRNLIARTLEDDAAQRPQDPVAFTEELRACLAAFERRQTLRQKFGIPFGPIVAKPPGERRLRIRRRRPVPLIAAIGSSTPPPAIEELEHDDEAEVEEVAKPLRMRPAWAIAIALAALFAIAAGAALFVPEDVVTAAFHRKKPAADIGVPVGVPENSQANIAQRNTAISKQPSPPTEATSAPSTLPGAVANAASSTSAPLASASNSSSVRPVVAQQSVTTPAQAAIAADSPPRTTTTESPNELVSTTVAAQTRSEPAASTETASNDDKNSAPGPAGTPVAVAENNVPSEPAPPSEQPNESPQASSEPPRSIHENTDRPSAESDSPSRATTSRSHASSDAKVAKSRTKKNATTTENRRQTRTLQGRVVGITPNGNVILELPSGGRAIVSPQDGEHYPQGQVIHHRPRRVIMERHVYDPQNPDNPPYQPFVGPND